MSDFGQHQRTGWIETVVGGVSAGKTEAVVLRARRALLAKRKVQCFKPIIDDRYAGIDHISSHNGATIAAVPVRNAYEILDLVEDDTKVVVIDEAQFLDDVVEVANQLADMGKRVICAGLNQDFLGRPFGRMGELMAISEQVDVMHAICVVCGELATRTQRLLDGKPAPATGPLVLVGGIEARADAYSYEARCRACHEIPDATAEQIDAFDPALEERPLFEGEPLEPWRWALENGGEVDMATGEVLHWGPKGPPAWAKKA